MATFNYFHAWTTDLANGVHNGCLAADSDVLKVYLSNTTPSASTHADKADLAEIAYGTDYTAPIDTQNTFALSNGVITVSGVDITITASTPDVATFQYVVLYNSGVGDAASDLVGWWDHQSPVDLTVGQPFLIDFQPALIAVSI